MSTMPVPFHTAGVRASAACAAVALVLALSGCVTHQYMGISLMPGEAPSDVQGLARLAQGGDKFAQLLLGIRYEEGLGVPVDLERARKFYTEAARNSAQTVPIYVSFPSDPGSGIMLPSNTGPVTRGLPEARTRLENLRKKRHQPKAGNP